MHVDVSLQLAQLALSVLTGFALGVLYDILRAMRRVFKIDAVLDVLFCAVLLLALFTLGMDIGQGECMCSCSAPQLLDARHICRC